MRDVELIYELKLNINFYRFFSVLQLWDTRKKGCIFGYQGHNGTVNSLKFSPDGQWIASGGDDNFVKVRLKITNIIVKKNLSKG